MPLHLLVKWEVVNWKVVSPDSRLGTVGIYIQYIYITKIVVLVSEPVRGRSRATELPCLNLCSSYYNILVIYCRVSVPNSNVLLSYCIVSVVYFNVLVAHIYCICYK